MILEEVADSCESLGDLVDGGRVGTADVSLAAFAEGAARDEGDVLLDEQVFGKFFIRIAARRDVREDVEGAFRLEARKAEFWNPS